MRLTENDVEIDDKIIGSKMHSLSALVCHICMVPMCLFGNVEVAL